MNKRLNVFKVFTAALLFSTNMVFASTPDSVVTKADIKANDSYWTDFLNSVRGAKLSQKVNIPSVELYRGIEIGGQYKFTSRPSVAQNYSGIDVWEIRAGIDSRIFNYDLPVNLAASAKKEITYIQQFKNRKDSLLRLPYDPLTKIPRSAQDFFRRDDGQLVFKSGDFIGYRIPLVFEASANILKNLGTAVGLNAGYRYFINGEFDIQIFRMTDNLVRLKIIAINDKTRSWFGGVKIFTHDPVTSLITEKLLDDRLYSGAITDRISDFYLGDYILNLDSTVARSLYDSIVAQKMKIFNVDLVREYISATQFLKDRGQFNETLFADLSKFNAIAAEDRLLPDNQKRVIKIVNSESHTKADDTSNAFNLVRLVKYTKNKNSSDARIAIVGDDAEDKENYYLHSVGKNSELSILDNWEKEKRSQLNLLFKSDIQGNKKDVVGFHFSKSLKHYSLRRKQYLEFYETTGQYMPQVIKNVIKFPHEGNGLRDKYHNTYVNFELYLTNKIFELNQNLSREVVEQRVNSLLQSISSLKNKVNEDEKLEIINSLTQIFSNDVLLDNKFELFHQLTLKNDIFGDHALALFANVINPETISDCILVQFSFSGHEIGSGVLKFPSEAGFNRINLFKYIIDQNNYILDRSYNLRNFLREDGAPFSLDEIILRNENLSKQH